MANIKVEGLGAAISKELTMYSKGVQYRINQAGRRAIKKLAEITYQTAPFNAFAYHQHYIDLIATKTEKSRIGDDTHIWYVKAPGYRLTHLLVDGHETRDGGRTRGDPFLQNAVDAVTPEYEKEVEEAIKNG